MKKIILIMAILLIASPAMATVNISCVAAGDGSGTVTVSYVATANDVRAFAFDVNALTANITAATRLDPNYFIHPGSTRLKDPGATIRTAGTVNCSGSFAGTLPGLGTNGVTTEQASLYEGGAANSPGGSGVGSSGDLFSIVVDANTTIEVRENTIRGGVVMEDPDEDPALTNAGGVLCSCSAIYRCWGDVGNTDGTYGHDGKVDTGDLIALLSELIVNGAGASYQLPAPGQFWLGDVGNTDGTYGQDNKVDTGDLIALLSELIVSGDSANNYQLPACFPIP
jgi:hypothetical protein